MEVKTRLWRNIPVQRSAGVRVRPKILVSDAGVAVSFPGQTSRQSEHSSHDIASGSTRGTGIWSSLMARKPGGQTATQAPQRAHIS